MKIRLVALNARYTHSCPALYYVRNELEKNMPERVAAIHQLTINDPYFKTLLRLTGEEVGAFFFSVYIWNAFYVRRLVDDICRVFPEVPVVLGGPQAPYLTVCEVLPPNCAIIAGPIEGIGRNFYDDLKHSRLQPEYVAEPGAGFDFPYRDEDFAELKNRSIYYESSRGCPFSCSYCLSSIDRGVSYHDSAEVKKNLAVILRHHPKTLRFVDRTFNANPGRAYEIWQYLAGINGDTLFHFEIAPDFFTEEMFGLFEQVKSGRFQFEIGIQSTNPPTLAAVNRRMDLSRAADNIKRLLALDNIHLHVDLILGLPHETEQTFKKSFNDVFALFPHYIQMGLLKILPGTPIAQKVDDFGIIHCKLPPYEVLATKWMDHDTVRRLHDFGECVEAFFNNRFFRETWRYIKQGGEDPFSVFMALVVVCQRHGFFQLSRTQELMGRMLYEFAEKRDDRDLLHDLLRFEWLRCGHRFLPEYLHNRDLRAARDKMWHELPDIYPPYYNNQTARNEFFKRAVFAEFSATTLKQVGFEDVSGKDVICFLPEQRKGVFRYQKTAQMKIKQILK